MLDRLAWKREYVRMNGTAGFAAFEPSGWNPKLKLYVLKTSRDDGSVVLTMLIPEPPLLVDSVSTHSHSPSWNQERGK